MNKFWNWVRNSDESRTLYLNGTIAEESWFDDDITPAAFKRSFWPVRAILPSGSIRRAVTAWPLLRFTVCSWTTRAL